MSVDNAARKSQTTDAHRSLHLVHSEAWRQAKARSKKTMHTHTDAQSVRHIRESHAIATLSLAAAALVAPAIWIGHALLHWMHVI